LKKEALNRGTLKDYTKISKMSGDILTLVARRGRIEGGLNGLGKGFEGHGRIGTLLKNVPLSCERHERTYCIGKGQKKVIEEEKKCIGAYIGVEGVLELDMSKSLCNRCGEDISVICERGKDLVFLK